MLRNLLCDSADNRYCYNQRITLSGYHIGYHIAKEGYQSHLVDQSVTGYNVKHRGLMLTLSYADQSLSDNVIILVYQQLQLCLIKCILEAKLSFIHYKPLAFSRASL